MKKIVYSNMWLLFVNLIFLLTSTISYSQITVSLVGTTQACNNDGSATISVSGGVGPYTFNWQDVWGTSVSNVQNPTNLSGGGYVVYVTDANSATGYLFCYVQPPFNINFDIATYPTCGVSDGVIAAEVQGGTAPFTFMWSNGVVSASANNIDTIFNVSQGQIDVTVTDANGCTYMPDSNAYLSPLPTFQLSTSTTPSNCDDGTASASVASGTFVTPLSYSWVHYNSTTSSNQTFTGSSLTGLEPGSYTVSATDASGCVATQWTNVPTGPNYLQTSAVSTPSLCPNTNGAIDLTILSGGTSPFTYAWSNGATTQDISGVAQGSYSVTITDAAGCVITRSKYVHGQTPIGISLSTVNPTCWNSDGSLTAIPSGGTAPYTYLWNGNVNTQTLGSVPEGGYYVTVTDANGCQANKYAYIQHPSSCWAYISGTVFNDLNGNCVVDAGDSPLPGQIIDFGGGNYYANSMQTGSYTRKVVPGTYSFSHVAPAGYSMNCPTAAYSVNAMAGNTYTGNDFYDEPDSIFTNLKVSMTSGAARPGFNHDYYIWFHNSGTFMINGSIEFTHDPDESLIGTSIMYSNYNSGTNTVTINFNQLLPNESRMFYVTTSVPASTIIGTPYEASIAVLPVATDIVPQNNYDSLDMFVTGSYDPNAKEVSPAGLGAPGYIGTDENVLEYTIHFQNTGNDTAFTVMIEDEIDEDLYIPSFQLHGASHPVDYIIDGRTIQFIFNNILLVDSTTNEPLSHGLVSYSIEQNPGLAVGTEITNTAYIYFDYNDPIVTNTTLNTIADINDVEEIASLLTDLNIYPNPFNDQITLQYSLVQDAQVEIRVNDAVGKLVQLVTKGSKQQGSYTETISFSSDLGHGMYFVYLTVNGQTSVKKIIH